MTGQTVLVIGSLHYDIMVEADVLPRPDETAIGRRWYPKFGGKGGNQAVAAAKAGAPTRMMGAVGDDGFGDFLLSSLDRAGVDRSHVRRLPATGSGMSVAIQDANGDYAATIVSSANLQIPIGGIGDEKLWEGAGVLLLQNEVPEPVNRAAAQAAQARGIPVLLNAAPARPLPDDLSAMVGTLIVNTVEAEMMSGLPVRDHSQAAAAAARLAETFACAIVTAGAHGIAVARTGESFALQAHKVAVVSTHGAGDSFAGTLAAGLARGLALRPACEQAIAAAALHVSGGA